ncbi:unnamed protein product [Paramecium sonneborni]|uniref:Transmembrane protein n=1 Tax=Paramecium sonneborni TaxID=65129 RepID=A0A8S1RIC9_9CILI|nr:unnamed protein product [Paramecium sonneborni]
MIILYQSNLQFLMVSDNQLELNELFQGMDKMEMEILEVLSIHQIISKTQNYLSHYKYCLKNQTQLILENFKILFNKNPFYQYKFKLILNNKQPFFGLQNLIIILLKLLYYNFKQKKECCKTTTIPQIDNS